MGITASKRLFLCGLAGAIVLVATAGFTAISYWDSRVGSGSSTGKFWEAISWRTAVFLRKVNGEIPDFSWSELWVMTRSRGGFGLANITARGRGIEGSVANPLITEDDLRTGAKIFHERCAGCHGSEGSGGRGPALNRRALKHGDSDLALYKVIRDGIPGTSMAAVDLKLPERWQVVGYLRRIQLQRLERTTTEAPRRIVNITAEQVRTAGSRTDEWITYSGSLAGHRHTALAEIAPSNVARLRLHWIKQLDTSASKIEATPLVADGNIFVTHPPGNLVAIDARSGEILWTYARRIPASLPLCCGFVNRGVAILGNRLFLGSLDGYLVAIDANTGQEIWHSAVADPDKGYTLTGAPLIAGRLVIVGVAGGEFGTRGYLTAVDAETGQQAWRFFTIPGPGERGHESWENDAWRTGGGATWNTGAYDPSLELVYWGVGNPGPDYSGDVRPGDNLFTNSVVALSARSGKLAWHFQFTPHDERDWDSAQTPVLVDLPLEGTPRKLLCWANRNGFYYVLDRTSGEFLHGTPFVEQNWAKGLDRNGRPIPEEEGFVSATGRLTKPGVLGATNWQNPAYDPKRELIFVHATEGASVFTKSATPRRGARGEYIGSGAPLLDPVDTVVRALHVTTGARKWEYFTPRSKELAVSYSGLLSTGSGLLFGAAGGYLFALDSATGKELWRVALGGETVAAPISFRIDGRQQLVVAAGRALFMFGL